MSSELTNEILSKLPKHPSIEIPPKIFVDMDGEFLEYVEGKSLTTRFPVKERYQNPLGAMQGGMIVAAMDNTYGPLSYMVAAPSVTTHMNATYIHPVRSILISTSSPCVFKLALGNFFLKTCSMELFSASTVAINTL